MMNNFLNNLWVVVKRLVVAIGPALLSLVFGMFLASIEAIRAMYEAHEPLTWGTLWTVGGGAAGAYFLLKVFSLNNQDWIRAFLTIADAVMTPHEALQAAAEQVKPMRSVDHIEEKVLKGVDVADSPAVVPTPTPPTNNEGS